MLYVLLTNFYFYFIIHKNINSHCTKMPSFYYILTQRAVATAKPINKKKQEEEQVKYEQEVK